MESVKMCYISDILLRRGQLIYMQCMAGVTVGQGQYTHAHTLRQNTHTLRHNTHTQSENQLGNMY